MTRATCAVLAGLLLAGCRGRSGADAVEYVSRGGIGADSAREMRVQVRVDSARGQVLLRLRIFDADTLVGSTIMNYGADKGDTCAVFSQSAWECQHASSLSASSSWALDGTTLMYRSRYDTVSSVTTFRAEPAKR